MRFRKILMIFVFVMLIGVVSGCNVHKHTLTEVMQVDATCNEEGVVHHYYCSGCKLYFSDKDGKSVIKDITIKKLDHVYGEWIESRTSCDEEGSATRTCTLCGHKENKTLVAFEHLYGEWKVTKEATCVDTGTKEKECTKCNHKVIEEIEKTSHTYKEWEVTNPATCQLEGEKEHVCSHCGHKETETIEKVPHDVTHNEEVSATCIKEGTIPHYHCSICDKNFEDEALTKELLDITIPKTDHTFHDLECIVCGYDTFEYPELKRYLESISEIDYTVKVNNFELELANLKVTFGELYIKAINEDVQMYGTLMLEYEKDILHKKGEEGYKVPVQTEQYTMILKDGYLYLIQIMDEVIDYEDPINYVYCTQHYEDYLIVRATDYGLGDDMIKEVIKVLDKMAKMEFNIDLDTNQKLCQVLDYILNGLFEKTKTDDKITYKLSGQKLIALNDTLYNKKISELVDELFGVGTYDNLDENIIELLNTKIGDLVVILEKEGIDLDQLDNFITQLLSFGEVDFHDMIGGTIKEVLTSEEVKDIIPIEFFMSFYEIETKEEIEGFITNMLTQLKDKTLYQLIGGMMDLDETALSDLHNKVNRTLNMIGKDINIIIETSLKGEFRKLSVQVSLGGLIIDFDVVSGNKLVLDYQEYIDKCISYNTEELQKTILNDCLDLLTEIEDEDISDVKYNKDDNTISFKYVYNLYVVDGYPLLLVNTYEVVCDISDMEYMFHPECGNKFLIGFTVHPNKYTLLKEEVYIVNGDYKVEVTDLETLDRLQRNNKINIDIYNSFQGKFYYDYDKKVVLADCMHDFPLIEGRAYDCGVEYVHTSVCKICKATEELHLVYNHHYENGVCINCNEEEVTE